MNIIIFCHPDYFHSVSMPKFVEMLNNGLNGRGHVVKFWKPKPYFSKINLPNSFKKWMGYIDSFLVFPVWVRFQLIFNREEALYVFADQALGPWVPLVNKFPHVIHCHDFLAQKSALNLIPNQRISFSGKLYQKLIRNGFKSGKNFISVSKLTQNDLNSFINDKDLFSKVIYNGVNTLFSPGDSKESRDVLSHFLGLELNNGYLLHVGGNQWYKNRIGIVGLYTTWREISDKSLPLILIGTKPSPELQVVIDSSKFSQDIISIENADDSLVKNAYRGAELFLFPSLAEGFGWPIAEAMASGTLVMTTGENPMTEVGGSVAFYHEKMPDSINEIINWKVKGAELLESIVSLPIDTKTQIINTGISWVKKFDQNECIDKIEMVYQEIISRKSA
ncbi:glycosyltransferase [Algoriphagus chordae]|uniref:Glycosyltransferase involved in cell wall biosynthesis n=1 Tax=Algoriphagus chordae TaxID=237019 RepID=A0A2W7RD20_9BACT|nr:glycosyltransferase [Algoriphagus chordae]PZX52079.1 glycosyltransferase involved in cell wall biosynthesis [Algoriphagus chordae]